MYIYITSSPGLASMYVHNFVCKNDLSNGVKIKQKMPTCLSFAEKLLTSYQGDQMSLWKIRPNCTATHFGQNRYIIYT
jgi:hypothetical protein